MYNIYIWYNIDAYTKPNTCFDRARQIAWVRYEEGYNETEGLGKYFLVTKQVCGFVFITYAACFSVT